MKQNFELVFGHLIGHEGGYGNHKDDKGGPTKYGVTLEVLRAWRGDSRLTAEDVKKIGLPEAKKIFRARYWDLLKCDDMPSGLDYAVADFGYNSGVGRAAKKLQTQLGVKSDGIIGPMTIQACNEIVDLTAFINKFQDRRLSFVKSLSNWPTFGKGWTRRIAEVRVNSLALAHSTQSDPPAVLAEATLTEIPPTPDAKIVVSPLKTAQQGSMLGAIGAGASDAAQQIAPYSDMLATLKWAFIALTIIGVGVGLFLTIRNLNKEA